MKKQFLIYSLFALFLGLTFVACDDSEELNTIEQELPAPSLTAYDAVVLGRGDTLQTRVADFKVAVGEHKFTLAGIFTDNEEDLSNASTLELFSIDEKSGQISIISTKAKKASELTLGKYYFTVGLGHMGGVAVYDSIASIEIIDLPFNISYTSQSYDLSFGQMGEFATVSLNSEDEGLEILKYELTSAPEGIVINETSGALSKETTNVIPGEYELALRVHTNNGFKDFVGLVQINVGEQPQLYYTQEGEQFSVINTTSVLGFVVELVGNTEDLGSGLVYSLKDTDIEGLIIDLSTGAITLAENSNVAEGNYPVNISVANAAGLEFDYMNLFTIKVVNPSDSPVLYYTQAGNQFAGVSLSSWSGFVVELGGPAEDLGTGLVYSLKDTDISGLSIDASSGAITLTDDSNLAEGDYTVSISVVNDASEVVDYMEMFSIEVVNEWEQIALDDIDVSGYADKEFRAVDDQYSFYETTMLNASAVEFISYKHSADAGTGFVAYGWGINLGKTLEIDAPLLREVDMDGTFRKMKVSFGETSVGKIQVDELKRRFYYGYSRTELIDNANFVDAEWNLLIAEDSEKWAVNNLKTDFKTIETEFDVSDPAQDKLYLQWRMTSIVPATGFTRAYFNAIKIEAMKQTIPVFN